MKNVRKIIEKGLLQFIFFDSLKIFFCLEKKYILKFFLQAFNKFFDIRQILKFKILVFDV